MIVVGSRKPRVATDPGMRFGMLVVLERIDVDYLSLRCDCGKRHRARDKRVRSGATRSCGCAIAVATRKRSFRHGEGYNGGKASTEWVTWYGMKQRCGYPKHVSYQDYGGRGITVCDRWLGRDGFRNFLADMGRKPARGMSIDRRDPDGNYEPANCRWATALEQRHNRRSKVAATDTNHATEVQTGA